LNDVCEDLRAGPDGETITWSEVKINVTSKLELNSGLETKSLSKYLSHPNSILTKIRFCRIY